MKSHTNIYVPAMDDDADYREVYAQRRGKLAYVNGSKLSNVPAHIEIARNGDMTLRGPVSAEALELASQISFTPPPTLAQSINVASLQFGVWLHTNKFRIMWDAAAFTGIAFTVRAIAALLFGMPH